MITNALKYKTEAVHLLGKSFALQKPVHFQNHPTLLVYFCLIKFKFLKKKACGRTNLIAPSKWYKYIYIYIIYIYYYGHILYYNMLMCNWLPDFGQTHTYL